MTWVTTSKVTWAQVQPSPAQRFQQQQLQIQQIKAQAETQIKALLTPEQLDEYKKARKKGAGMLDALDVVSNLSEEQQTKINAITRKASRAILDLLPPAQNRR